MLMPRKKTPELKLPLLGGGSFDLDADPGAERGTLLVVYRGLHCPLCVPYLKELDEITPALAERVQLQTCCMQGLRAPPPLDHCGITYTISGTAVHLRCLNFLPSC